MDDNLIDLNTRSEEEQQKEEQKQTSWWIGRWSHVLAGLSFCLVYFPFSGSALNPLAAIMVAYLVFMVCCACGLSFRDSDDLLGSQPVQRYMGTLLLKQVLILAAIAGVAYAWVFLRGVLPAWATEGKRLPLWDVVGIVLAYYLGVSEARWIAVRIRERFPELGVLD